MLFRTKSRKGSPEGKSILRNAYRSWYFKRRIQEIEGIGIERDLAGFPTLTAPEGMNIWDDDDPDMAAVRVAADRNRSKYKTRQPRRIVPARRMEAGAIKHRRRRSLTPMQSSRDTTPG
jgi:hypothetical protein